MSIVPSTICCHRTHNADFHCDSANRRELLADSLSLCRIQDELIIYVAEPALRLELNALDPQLGGCAIVPRRDSHLCPGEPFGDRDELPLDEARGGLDLLHVDARIGHGRLRLAQADRDVKTTLPFAEVSNARISA